MREYTEIEKQILKVLDVLRPYLQRDGGDLEFISFVDGIVNIRMLGACALCMGVDDTFEGIESVLIEQVPGVIGVNLETPDNEF